MTVPPEGSGRASRVTRDRIASSSTYGTVVLAQACDAAQPLAPGAKSVQARGPWPSGAPSHDVRFVTRRGAIVPFVQGRSFVRQPPRQEAASQSTPDA
jgi:hypothetical protein